MTTLECVRVTLVCTFLLGGLVTAAFTFATVLDPGLWPSVGLVALSTPVVAVLAARRVYYARTPVRG